LFAVRDEHLALDIVQDSMTKLVEKYASKPLEELPLLFQRILQNTIRDFYRRQKTRSLWTTLFSSFIPGNRETENEDYDPLETMETSQPGGSSNFADPRAQLEQSQLMDVIEKAIKTLPPRQREAFLLRYWEEMDVSETSRIMGCSEGSVKTHCSRAAHTLGRILKKDGIEL
jgi:RNA polymerase sigma-70 factor (ECF subfamily)